MQESGYEPRITLHVRSLCPAGADTQQKGIVERLRALDETGDIDEFSIEVWGSRVPCDAQTAVGSSMLERIEAFETWSDRTGVSIAPFFETRTSGSLLTEEPRETIVPPAVSLAEFHDETLHYVTPCVEDGRVWTVADRLDTIENGTSDITQHGTSSD